MQNLYLIQWNIQNSISIVYIIMQFGFIHFSEVLECHHLAIMQGQLSYKHPLYTVHHTMPPKQDKPLY